MRILKLRFKLVNNEFQQNLVLSESVETLSFVQLRDSILDDGTAGHSIRLPFHSCTMFWILILFTKFDS